MADRTGVQRVARAGWHAVYDDIIGADRVDATIDSWYDEDALSVDVERASRPFFVAIADDRVVGFVEGAPPDHSDQDSESGPPDTYELYRIYVHPEHWEEGIGTRLLDRLVSDLDERGVDQLRLSVLADNERAVDFYEERGFDRVATSRDEEFDAERYTYVRTL